MKAITAIALVTGAAAVTAAAIVVVLKKRNEKLKFSYDAGDLEKDDCCSCEVCSEGIDLEPMMDEADDADTAEPAPAEAAADADDEEDTL